MDTGELREGYADILKIVNVKEEEIPGVWKHLRADKSPGPDGINSPGHCLDWRAADIRRD